MSFVKLVDSLCKAKNFHITVRTKVTEILALIGDDDKLREERKKARKLKDKYVGVSGGFGKFLFSTDFLAFR